MGVGGKHSKPIPKNLRGANEGGKKHGSARHVLGHGTKWRYYRLHLHFRDLIQPSLRDKLHANE